MIKTQIGIGKSSDVQEAVKEATVNFENPTLILVCSEADKLSECTEILYKKYPEAMVISTTGYSIALGKAVENNIILASISDGVEIQSGVIENLSKYPLKSIKKLEESIININPGIEDTVCLEFCTCNEEMLVSTMNSVLEDKNIPLVGGTAQGVNSNGEKVIYLNGKVYKDACVYILIKNLNGKIKTYKESIYKDTNKKLIATKVDEATRKITELNDKRAEVIYCENLNIKKEDIPKYSMKYPFGKVVGNEIYITAINSEFVDKDGLHCYKRVNKNDELTILELDDYERIVKETCNKIQDDFKNISFIFSVNCILRYLLFKEINYIDEYAKEMSSLGNFFGIVSEGEQYINQHINQTMICAVFE